MAKKPNKSETLNAYARSLGLPGTVEYNRSVRVWEYVDTTQTGYVRGRLMGQGTEETDLARFALGIATGTEAPAPEAPAPVDPAPEAPVLVDPVLVDPAPVCGSVSRILDRERSRKVRIKAARQAKRNARKARVAAAKARAAGTR